MTVAGQNDSGQAAKGGAIPYQPPPAQFVTCSLRLAGMGKLPATVGAKLANRDTGGVTRVDHFTDSL